MRYNVPISVIIPCYNSADFVLAAIKSILKQSFSNFELIVINDGSTDETDYKVSAIKDKRIIYRSLDINKGNYAARNIGLKMSSGKYIAVMDSDDIAHHKRLEIQYQYLEKHKQIGCIGSSAFLIDDNNRKTGVLNKIQEYGWLKTYLIRNNYTLHPSLMIRKSSILAHDLQYNESFKYAADYDFVVRCAEKFPIVNLPDKLLKYRIHAKQISTAKRKEQTMYADLIRLKQLNTFGMFSTDQTDTYLNVMKGLKPVTMTTEDTISFFNMLLEINNQKRIFNKSKLQSVFIASLKYAINGQGNLT